MCTRETSSAHFIFVVETFFFPSFAILFSLYRRKLKLQDLAFIFFYLFDVRYRSSAFKRMWLCHCRRRCRRNICLFHVSLQFSCWLYACSWSAPSSHSLIPGNIILSFASNFGCLFLMFSFLICTESAPTPPLSVTRHTRRVLHVLRLLWFCFASDGCVVRLRHSLFTHLILSAPSCLRSLHISLSFLCFWIAVFRINLCVQRTYVPALHSVFAYQPFSLFMAYDWLTN